jgi:putative glutamine amidotransferase
MKKPLSIFIFLVCVSMKLSHGQHIVLISKDKNENIKKWLMQSDSNLITKEFYFLNPDSQQYYISRANGIVIGGGEDINPSLYQQAESIVDCGKIDNYRDSIEYVLIKYAINNKKAIMGICRGQQILNVASGGSLIVDIPKAIKTNIKHSQAGVDSVHWVHIKSGSWLQKTMHLDSLVVKIVHHQAVKKISDKFKVTALSPDGVIEAIEWKDTTHPFAAGLQWHPERLYNDASKRLSQSFVLKLKGR